MMVLLFVIVIVPVVDSERTAAPASEEIVLPETMISTFEAKIEAFEALDSIARALGDFTPVPAAFTVTLRSQRLMAPFDPAARPMTLLEVPAGPLFVTDPPVRFTVPPPDAETTDPLRFHRTTAFVPVTVAPEPEAVTPTMGLGTVESEIWIS